MINDEFISGTSSIQNNSSFINQGRVPKKNKHHTFEKKKGPISNKGPEVVHHGIDAMGFN
ncbi:MAG TPA: hypothetical protein ENK09_00395 [Nitrospirae bacterium]|nr:hypothetical protein [Nitrospirota bacterium]